MPAPARLTSPWPELNGGVFEDAPGADAPKRCSQLTVMFGAWQVIFSAHVPEVGERT
jgi:hypothetical protein